MDHKYSLVLEPLGYQQLMDYHHHTTRSQGGVPEEDLYGDSAIVVAAEKAGTFVSVSFASSRSHSRRWHCCLVASIAGSVNASGKMRNCLHFDELAFDEPEKPVAAGAEFVMDGSSEKNRKNH